MSEHFLEDIDNPEKIELIDKYVAMVRCDIKEHREVAISIIEGKGERFKSDVTKLNHKLGYIHEEGHLWSSKDMVGVSFYIDSIFCEPSEVAGVKSVGEILSAAKSLGINYVMIYTNALFTNDAKKLADEYKIETLFIDRNMVIPSFYQFGLPSTDA